VYLNQYLQIAHGPWSVPLGPQMKNTKKKTRRQLPGAPIYGRRDRKNIIALNKFLVYFVVSHKNVNIIIRL